jgi:metal-dependent HD superfamily phosphatase/phosphodiesterase
MEANKNKKVKDSIMERIISHSQAKMLEAITALGWKVEALVQKANSVDPAKGKARMAIVGDEGAEIL